MEPIDLCAKCRAPVDMTEFHLTYVESEEVHENSIAIRTVDMDYLAVLCRRCQPAASDKHATSPSFEEVPL
jgi:hypothetical protein